MSLPPMIADFVRSLKKTIDDEVFEARGIKESEGENETERERGYNEGYLEGLKFAQGAVDTFAVLMGVSG